jgi:hypothetical protein
MCVQEVELIVSEFNMLFNMCSELRLNCCDHRHVGIVRGKQNHTANLRISIFRIFQIPKTWIVGAGDGSLLQKPC